MLKILNGWFNQYFSDEEAVLLLFLLVASFVVVLVFGQMLAPVFTAMVLAYLMQGMVNGLVKRNAPRMVSLSIVYSMALGIFMVLLFWLLPLSWQQLTSLLNDQLPSMISEAKVLLMKLPEQYPDLVSVKQTEKWVDMASTELGAVGQTILSFSISKIPNVMAVMIYLVLVPLLVFFFLKDQLKIVSWFLAFLPSKRDLLEEVWSEMNDQVSNYVRGKALEILIVGGVSFAAFAILGLNYSALLAMLVGLSVVVPYVGAAVVTIPVALVAYLQYGWGGGVGSEFFTLMIVYGVIQALDGNVLVPLLFSEAVNLHPVAIIVAILVFGGLWGFWGVFFAIPLATLCKAVISAWPTGSQRDDDCVIDEVDGGVLEADT